MCVISDSSDPVSSCYLMSVTCRFYVVLRRLECLNLESRVRRSELDVTSAVVHKIKAKA